MTRTDIIAEVAKDTGVAKSRVKPIVQSYEKCIAAAIAGGNNVSLHGFINLDIIDVASRNYKNFQGEVVTAPPTKRVKTRLSKNILLSVK